MNYLGMVFDLTHKSEAKVTMKGYVEDMLMCSETPGGARTPGAENLFAVRPDMTKATEAEKGHFCDQYTEYTGYTGFGYKRTHGSDRGRSDPYDLLRDICCAYL